MEFRKVVHKEWEDCMDAVLTDYELQYTKETAGHAVLYKVEVSNVLDDAMETAFAIGFQLIQYMDKHKADKTLYLKPNKNGKQEHGFLG